MNAYRTIINSDRIDSVIPLPQGLKHKQVEVLIISYEEKISKKIKKKFNPDDYIGMFNIKDSKKVADSLRNEWERF